MAYHKPLALRDVRLTDGLVQRLQLLVRDQVLPYQWEILNDRVADAAKSHCIENFRIAAGLSEGEHYGVVFQDSDLYKWLEATAYCIERFPDPAQEARADETCELIRLAQQPDGYINTYYTIREPEGRFQNLQQGHELYCAGHLFEAAAAYYRATGKRAILETACRFADSLTRVFGTGEGQIPGYPGHQEVEVGLVKLYRVTQNEAYLKLAQYFIAQRGAKPSYFERERAHPGYRDLFAEAVMHEATYAQTHLPPVCQTEAVGHAVRALYMYSAMADLAALTGDAALREASVALCQSVVNRRMYITGGVGSTEHGESFTGDYDLPNDSIYGETCASVALMMFASRMAALTGEGKYYDTVERAFFNQVLGGISQAGTAFFYVGPLAVDPGRCRVNPDLAHVKPVRQRWFDVACCPTNIARTVMSFGGYAFGEQGDTLYLHIPLACEIRTERFGVRVQTEYPFGSALRVEALAAGQRVAIRQSGLAPVHALRINGNPIEIITVRGYIHLPVLDAGDVAEADLAMSPHYVVSHPAVGDNVGKAAVMRGPLVYCAEQADNPGGVFTLALAEDLRYREHEAFAGHGAVAITVRGARAAYPAGDELYRSALPVWEPQTITLIPYYLWANRGEGEMLTYLNVRPCAPESPALDAR